MTREPTERCLAKRAAQAMRAAALRLARERAGEDADPAQTYGCVDWYRYDVASTPQEEIKERRLQPRATLAGEAAGRRLIDQARQT